MQNYEWFRDAHICYKIKKKSKENRNRNSALVVTPGKKGVKTKGGRKIESEKKKVDRRKIASVK